MPELDVLVIVFDEEITATVDLDGSMGVEVDLGSPTTTGSITDVEFVEVTIPDKIQFEDTVKNEGNVAGLMLLEAAEPVPPGTPVGTVILRKP